jgi:hypothetical protein
MVKIPFHGDAVPTEPIGALPDWSFDDDTYLFDIELPVATGKYVGPLETVAHGKVVALSREAVLLEIDPACSHAIEMGIDEPCVVAIPTRDFSLHLPVCRVVPSPEWSDRFPAEFRVDYPDEWIDVVDVSRTADGAAVETVDLVAHVAPSESSTSGMPYRRLMLNDVPLESVHVVSGVNPSGIFSLNACIEAAASEAEQLVRRREASAATARRKRA